MADNIITLSDEDEIAEIAEEEKVVQGPESTDESVPVYDILRKISSESAEEVENEMVVPLYVGYNSERKVRQVMIFPKDLYEELQKSEATVLFPAAAVNDSGRIRLLDVLTNSDGGSCETTESSPLLNIEVRYLKKIIKLHCKREDFAREIFRITNHHRQNINIYNYNDWHPEPLTDDSLFDGISVEAFLKPKRKKYSIKAIQDGIRNEMPADRSELIYLCRMKERYDRENRYRDVFRIPIGNFRTPSNVLEYYHKEAFEDIDSSDDSNIDEDQPSTSKGEFSVLIVNQKQLKDQPSRRRDIQGDNNFEPQPSTSKGRDIQGDNNFEPQPSTSKGRDIQGDNNFEPQPSTSKGRHIQGNNNFEPQPSTSEGRHIQGHNNFEPQPSTSKGRHIQGHNNFEPQPCTSKGRHIQGHNNFEPQPSTSKGRHIQGHHNFEPQPSTSKGRHIQGHNNFEPQPSTSKRRHIQGHHNFEPQPSTSKHGSAEIILLEEDQPSTSKGLCEDLTKSHQLPPQDELKIHLKKVIASRKELRMTDDSEAPQSKRFKSVVVNKEAPASDPSKDPANAEASHHKQPSQDSVNPAAPSCPKSEQDVPKRFKSVVVNKEAPTSDPSKDPVNAEASHHKQPSQDSVNPAAPSCPKSEQDVPKRENEEPEAGEGNE
ncbi:uncharacterized protein LOC129960704 [Argiope bruennichi]|uniref:uncharacterized protein LOC129960704 n=1 Tax=Argiope bruennichi TaxID=94029 RepID=UPI0024942D9C|nr:uncharacterized protein LOC129960704 [Argiope bruennichi]